MDALKNAFSGSSRQNVTTTDAPEQKGSGGLFGSVNNALGGGKSGEANEDYLDKGKFAPHISFLRIALTDPLDSAVDFAQERMGQGQQSDESALEQAKDEQISDFIRSQYKGATGRDFPVADKS